MGAFIFAVVIVVAIVVVLVGRSPKEKAYDAYKIEREQREGHTPEQAWTIHHPDEMDKYVRRQRCHCGSKIWKRSEGTPPDAPQVRVAVCECYRCEEVIRLYFEIEYLN